MIGAVKEDGANNFYIYDEDGTFKAPIYGGDGDRLCGYTSTTVSIKKADGSTAIYDENGCFMHTIY